MKNLCLFVVFSLASLWSLQVSAQKGTMELDLSDYNLPMLITVPAGCEVSTGNEHGAYEGEGYADDYNVYHLLFEKEDFRMVLLTDDIEYIDDPIEMVAEELKYKKESKLFDAVILEEPNGFIIRTKVDDTYDYVFYYVFALGDMTIEFTNGEMMDFYTEPQIRAIYQAAKSARAK